MGTKRKSPKVGGATLVDHLTELRTRLWICVVSILLFSIGGFLKASVVIEWLKAPAGTSLPILAFFSPPEAMLAHLKVGLTVGLFLSMPVLLYELWVFVRPGLTRPERRYGAAFVLWGSLLFAGGTAFAYWGLLPVSLRFLLGFGEETLTPVISVSRYLSFTLAVILICGFLFELPVVIFFLTKLGLVTPEGLSRHWKSAFLGIVVAAALLTPTHDIVNLLLMVLPLLLLYGISILVSKVAMAGQRANR